MISLIIYIIMYVTISIIIYDTSHLCINQVLRRFLSRDITIVSERERKSQEALY